MIVECESCHGKNRVPSERLDQQARCGRCKAALAPFDHPVHVASVDEFGELVQGSPLPVNVMAMPGLPPVAALADAGIRRISLGPALFKLAYAHADRAARAFLGGDLAPSFEVSLDYEAMNRMFVAI